MTKLILWIMTFFTLLMTSVLTAQDFYGQAIYESKTQIKGFQISSSNVTEDMKKKMEEQMKKAMEKTFVLSFNKAESIYQQEQKLEAPVQNAGMSIMVNNDGKKYKNVREQVEVTEEDFFGKEFLITDSLKKWDWVMENETKKIGNYTAYKAVVTIPVSQEDMEAYEKSKNQKEQGKTQFIMNSEPKDQMITVWYTPEIPVSHGPDKYWGLPGLILEANDGTTTFLCSKIVLNPNEKIVIKRPTKGKKVNRKEYAELTAKQLEKMKDANGNIRITVGN